MHCLLYETASYSLVFISLSDKICIYKHFIWVLQKQKGIIISSTSHRHLGDGAQNREVSTGEKEGTREIWEGLGGAEQV